MDKQRIKALGQPHVLEKHLRCARLVDAVDEQTVQPVPGDRKRFAVSAKAKPTDNFISQILYRRSNKPLPTVGTPANATFLMLVSNMAFHVSDEGILTPRFCWSSNYQIIAQSVMSWNGSDKFRITDDSTVAATCDIPQTFGLGDGLSCVLRVNTWKPTSVVVERISHDLKDLIPTAVL